MSQPLEAPLTPYQQLLINKLERSFRCVVTPWINVTTDIVTPEFESAFKTRLLFHHTVTDEVLNKKSFEYAFRDAMRVSGRRAEINTSGTARGYDVRVDNDRYSLKTEAENSIRENVIHISKLMECAWLRYVGGSREVLVERIKKYLLPHFDNYDRILSLRIFRGFDINLVKYVLVEIPREMFLEVGNLQPEDFREINQRNGTSAKVRYRGVDAFTLRFDGSDEKVTISGLLVDLCTIHAGWEIPVLFTSPDL